MSSSQKPTTERITVNREFRTEAAKPGGPVLALRMVFTGSNGYGWGVGVANVALSGVKTAGDDFGGDIPITGMYAILGDKKNVSVTLDSPPHGSPNGHTISGQMSLASDLKTGYTTFTYTSKDGAGLTTVENVKVNAARTGTYKD